MSRVIWQDHPLSSRVHTRYEAQGVTLADIASRSEVPDGFAFHGSIRIGGHLVPRERWHLVRPKEGSDVTLHMPLHGGGSGGGGGKATIRLIAAIIIVVAATLVSAGALAPILGSSFAAGTLGATLAAGAVSLGGALLLGAFVKPPALGGAGTDGGTAGGEENRLASLSGNVLRRGAPVPRVVGEVRVFPPFLCQPLFETDGYREYVEVVYGLAGPHRLNDIQIGGVGIDDVEQIEYETREGFPGDAALTVVDRYGKTQEPNIELTRQEVDEQEDPAVHLKDQATPANSLPTWHRVNTLDAPDEVWVTLGFQEGIFYQTEPTEEIAVPIRVRVRARGDSTWVNIPELHVGNVRPQPFQRMLKFKWGTWAGVDPPVQKGFNTALISVPTQTASPVGLGGWTADAYYDDGSGTDYLQNGGVSGTAVRNVDLYEDHCDVWLNSSDIPVGPLEIEIMRGTGFIRSDFTLSTYLYGGNVKDFFGYYFQNPTVDAKFAYVAGDSGSALPDKLPSTFTAGSTVDTLNATLGSSYVLVAGDRFLLLNTNGLTQANNADNGVWVVQPSGAAVRATDHDSDAEIRAVVVTVANPPHVAFSGSTFNDRPNWLNTNGSAITVGVTLITYGVFSGTPDNFARVPLDQNILNDNVVVQRAVRVFNDSPVPLPGYFATIALRAYGRSIQQLSVLAAGYVPDWNGSTWTGNNVTSNPAPHFRDVLVGDLNADPLPTALLDDQNLVDWRAACVSLGYEVNMVVEGQSAGDVLSAIASCGYARPRWSEVWGVARDFDMSAESPVQVFTPRNSNDFRWERAFPKRPDGLRVRFTDRDEDYREREIIVPHPDTVGDPVFLEDIRYEGLVTEAQVTARATYDLLQSTERFTFYSLRADIEALVCTKGSLVAVQHDTITQGAGFTRVKEVLLDSGDVVGLTFDGSVVSPDEQFFDATDDFFEDSTPGEDFFTEEGSIGVAVRLKDGTIIVHEATVVDADQQGHAREVLFDTPFADPGSILAAGCLVATGSIGQEYRRCIVLDVTPRSELTAQLTLVDEAPELWA